MSEEKKDHQDSCCSGGEGKSAGGCGCGGGCGIKKLLVGLIIGAFVFAAGMWYAKANCHKCTSGGDMGKMCPMGGKMSMGSVEAK